MTSPAKPIARVIRHIPFSSERVFAAWLNPSFASKWLFATPTGKMVRAQIDGRVGGRFTFVDRRAGEDVEHTGEYLEIERSRRLVFTFGVPKFSPNFDRVTIELVQEPAGCVLTLTHELHPDNAEWAARSTAGWTHIVETMAAEMGSTRTRTNLAPGEFTAAGELRFMRLLPGPIERIWACLTDPEKRAKWFAGGPMELRPEGKAELFFHHANLAPDEKPPEGYAGVHEPGVRMASTITRCEPPRVLAFTMTNGEPPTISEATFELTPADSGDVQLVLTHRRLGTDRKTVASIGAGWHTHVAMLDALLCGDTPPPFWATYLSRFGEYEKRLG
jgi:uncharacterized protein YndB with AHSA1/START domain